MKHKTFADFARSWVALAQQAAAPQLICKHPYLTSSRELGDTTVSVWGCKPRAAEL